MSSRIDRRFVPRSSLYRSLCCGLALGALLASASACGGRWRTTTTTPDDDSSDNGGAVGVAGASPSHAGASGASTGQAGANGAGAGSSSTTCNNVACPAIACASGSVPVTPAGECCQVCQAVCKQVCAACGPGTQPEMHAGECCPECVPTTSCAAGQMAYQDVRDMASYKFAFGCNSDADCAVVAPANSCESGCASVAVLTGELDLFADYLKNEADQDCAACTQGPVPPCVAPMAAHCLNNGQCVLSPP